MLVTCWFDDNTNRLELRGTDVANAESAVYTGAMYACELRPASASGTATQAEREAAATAVLQYLRLDAKEGVLTTDASTGPPAGAAGAVGTMDGTIMKRGVSVGASFFIMSVDETPCGVAIRGFDVVQTRPLRCEVRTERREVRGGGACACPRPRPRPRRRTRTPATLSTFVGNPFISTLDPESGPHSDPQPRPTHPPTH